MSAKKQYSMLLNNGILLELYEELEGNWELDKDSFTKIYEANLFFTEHLETDYDEI